MTLHDETLQLAAGGTGPRVGVLALQGDFREHAIVLGQLGANVSLVRRPSDLDGLSGIVLPGGESSVMDKLARIFGLFDPLRDLVHSGFPAYGTCAGLILLADQILDAAPGQQTLGGLDVVVRRNAFGAQNQSFETDLNIPELGPEPVHATFIRGPVVESVGPKARVLSALPDGRVVAVEQGGLLATSFHPEMNGEVRFHEYFLRRIADR
ncbi:MAG: pyridoxal 5'-phosphate synthase glutaminase subunit PdxT [Agromyces sp.]